MRARLFMTDSPNKLENTTMSIIKTSVLAAALALAAITTVNAAPKQANEWGFQNATAHQPLPTSREAQERLNY
jgi:hypothetical protein